MRMRYSRGVMDCGIAKDTGFPFTVAFIYIQYDRQTAFKTQLLTIDPCPLENGDLDIVDKFTSLGSSISKDGLRRTS